MPIFRLLVQDRQGSILPIFGLLVILLVVIGGAAIDVSRAVNAREKLSYAVDAASISLAVELSGRKMNDADIRLHVSNSFAANIKDDDWKQRAIDNIEWTINEAEGWVEIRSSSRLEDYFLGRLMGYGMDAIGPEKLNFGTMGRAAYGEQDMEIALALDITGSMDQSDMAQLRKAATNLVSELIPQGTRRDSTKVRIGLVPWVDSINAELIPGILDSDDSAYGYWQKRCISGRHTDHQFEEYPIAPDGRSHYMRAPEAVHWGSRPSDWRRDYPQNFGCPWSSPVVPITADRDELLTQIDRLRSGGGTAVHLGLEFAWRLLSPEWGRLFPRESEPKPYGGPVKIALLMTDGDSNTAYSVRTEKSECTWPDGGACTPPGRGEPEWFWTYHGSFGWESETYKRAQRYCDILKDRGVVTWTIFFDNNVRSNSPERLMAYCAANGGEYIKVESADRMTQAFTAIAKKIQNVYLAR